MHIESTHIEFIQLSFQQLQSKEDLAALLSYAKRMMYGEDSNPVPLRSLGYYSDPKNCKNRYQTFQIKKKSGGERTIHAPTKGLKTILRTINIVLQCMHHPHRAATGFVPGLSIVDNAQKHVGQAYVYNLDLKNFFHSFDRNRVKVGLMREPFNLHGQKEPLAFLLASLCTHPMELDGETKIVLPQGSPASPAITNILCSTLDRRLNGLAKRFGLVYTRYADDITFSGGYRFTSKKAFIAELERIIESDQLLQINPSKTRLQGNAYRKEVTGLVVNDKVNVTRRYIKSLRMWLYYWEKYGYEKADEIFCRDYVNDKGHVIQNVPKFQNVLNGKLEYLRMVKGSNDGTYMKLKQRFDNLMAPKDPINELLEGWEEHGIKYAMEMYYGVNLSDGNKEV